MKHSRKQLLEIYEAIGFKLIHINKGEKGPKIKDWQNNPTPYKSLKKQANLGLIHGLSGTCVIDFDSELAIEVLKHLGLMEIIEQSAIFWIVGNPENHPKPIFRVPVDQHLTRKVLKFGPIGKTETIFELRSSGSQDILPPSIHPKTKKPYIWLDDNVPSEFSDIPELPQEILDLWVNWKTYLPKMKELDSSNPKGTIISVNFDANSPAKVVDTKVKSPIKTVAELFNKDNNVVDIIENAGYIETPIGSNKWLAPNSSTKMPGVTFAKEYHGCVVSYHGSCPLGDELPHDAWDCEVILNWDNDRRKALKHYAKEYGVKFVGAGEIIPEDLGSLLSNSNTTEEYQAQCVLRMYPDTIGYSETYGWCIFDKTHWLTGVDGEFELQMRISAMLKKRRLIASATENAKFYKNCIATKARVNNILFWIAPKAIRLEVNDFNSDDNLINCANGILDLRTGELAEHNHTPRFNYILDTEYNPDADTTQWESFVQSSLVPDGVEINKDYSDLLAWVRRAFGYALTGHTDGNFFIYMYGDTRTGKSTFLRVFSRLIDQLSDARSFNTFTRTKDDNDQNFDLAGLANKRLVTASESKEGQIMNTAAIKEMTGIDKVTAAFKGKDAFTYTPKYLIVLATNNKMVADSRDAAFWLSRVRILHFPNSRLHHEDLQLFNKLTSKECLEGILKWAVSGSIEWFKLYDEGKALKTPSIMESEIVQHRKENSTVGMWLEQECAIDGTTRTRSSELYQAYKLFCEREGFKPYKGHRFNQELERHGLPPKKNMGNVERVKTPIALAYEGIKLLVVPTEFTL